MNFLKKSDLAKELFSRCYLEGDFKLRSGIRSKEYFDKYLMESEPQILSAVADRMIPLVPQGTELLAGLSMGGIPLAVALALKMNLPVCFVRKKAKDYGTMRICEGQSVNGKRLCVIEDVVTSGGQAVKSAKDLKSEGGYPRYCPVCDISRGEL